MEYTKEDALSDNWEAKVDDAISSLNDDDKLYFLLSYVHHLKKEKDYKEWLRKALADEWCL